MSAVGQQKGAGIYVRHRLPSSGVNVGGRCEATLLSLLAHLRGVSKIKSAHFVAMF